MAHRHEIHEKHKKHHSKHHKHGGKIHDESAEHHEHHNKVHKKHHLAKGGSANRNEFGNKNVLEEAREGAHGEHHIAGGLHSSKLGRKRGGHAAHHGHHGHHRAHGGHVGADKHPFSSAATAHDRHGEDD